MRRELTDAAALEVSGEGRERMREAFLASSRYELAFWEMAWREETPAGSGAANAENRLIP